MKSDFYDSALEIAERKLFRTVTPGPLTVPRLGTGGNFANLFLWDTAFSVHWAKYHPERFPVRETLDNFYRVQEPSGFISRETMPDGISRWKNTFPVAFAPPLLPWAELALYEKTKELSRLEKVYPHLKKQHLFNTRSYRRSNGLFFTDMLGSGMDELPRWDTEEDLTEEGGIPFSDEITQEGPELAAVTLRWLRSKDLRILSWNRQLSWCDTSCQMAFSALTLSRISAVLEKKEDSLFFRTEHDTIAEKVNDFCYDEKKHFYFDRTDRKLLSRRHVGAFWALLGEIPDREQASYLMDALEDKNAFNCPCGVPGIAVDDPEFMVPGAYWRGPVWAPVNYMVLCGLRAYGNEELARKIAAKLSSMAEQVWKETGTVWENYDPMSPKGRCQKDFCGWSALLAVAIPREFC